MIIIIKFEETFDTFFAPKGELVFENVLDVQSKTSTERQFIPVYLERYIDVDVGMPNNKMRIPK